MSNRRQTSAGVEQKRDAKARRALAVPLMVQGRTNAEIGARLDVHPDVVSRWRQEPEVAAQVLAAQERLALAAVEGLEALQGRAIETLADLLDAEETNVRLGAAKTVLEYTKAKPRSDVDVTSGGERITEHRVTHELDAGTEERIAAAVMQMRREVGSDG